MLKHVHLLCLALPLASFTQSCDNRDHSDKKELKKKLAYQQDQTIELLQEKAAKDQQAAQDAKTIEANKKKIEELQQSATNNSDEIARLQQENDKLLAKSNSQASDLAALEQKLALDEKAIASKNERLNQLNIDLTAARQSIEGLNKDIAQQKELIASKEKELAEKLTAVERLEKENADLRNQNTAATVVKLQDDIKKISADLAKAKDSETQLSTQLAEEQKRSADLQANLKVVKAQAVAVQVFLANAAPDSLFVMEPDMVTETYNVAADANCTFIFNINRNTDVVRGPARDRVPQLSDRTMLPLKSGYQKVAVCRQGDKVQAQIETGSIYQSVPNNNRNAVQLVTAREKSSCEDAPIDVSKNAFASTYQVFYPYRGQIDGIETIDMMRPNSELIRYNMASSAFDFRGASCADVLDLGVATDLSVLACRLALGQDPGVAVIEGCFTEGATNGKTDLTFTQR